MPPLKRQKLDDPPQDDPEPEQAPASDEDDSDASGGFSASDSDDEHIEGMKPQKSRQTKKRKIRASGTTTFGATLQSLLSTDAPSALPLSLKPSLGRKRNDEKLELRAKKVLQVERKEKEDKGRIVDVIGGWGGESERALRKVAQRGVVKLFNVIQQSQASASVAAEETKAARGSGKPTLPAPVIADKTKKGPKKKDNVLGRAKEAAVEKDDFFDMIRSGGIATAPRTQQKISIRAEEWDRRLHEVQVTKHDLNRLIMDYLVIEGYKSAAEEFCVEANLTGQVDVDFDSIESRMDIRDALQRGDVEDAIARVNDLNPEILDTNPALYFHLQQQKLIEFIRHGQIAEALQFAQDELAPRGEESPEFLSELERTMALLAFDAAPGAPSGIAELLSPAQRMKTAGEVNAAILESLSQGKEVKLVGLLKLMSWGETMLEERAEFPRVAESL
ncbi:CTLH/CRA C-terminal to lish motif domain-containing protein [Mycena alexandri]|uniref:CTLH/CRA C-terminal to lish motif domain-containing protein n=1 Tax=Mycena alexandri TaxID=1745969 RepID=A0AAD6X6C9_9AGAR|nr:CTLH/CRA C-terminal to lish motif domain-containing protein [Mycena alexandri]